MWPAYATVKFLEGIKKMEDFTGNAIDKVGDAADKVGDTADKVGDKVKDAPKSIKKLFVSIYSAFKKNINVFFIFFLFKSYLNELISFFRIEKNLHL